MSFQKTRLAFSVAIAIAILSTVSGCTTEPGGVIDPTANQVPDALDFATTGAITGFQLSQNGTFVLRGRGGVSPYSYCYADSRTESLFANQNMTLQGAGFGQCSQTGIISGTAQTCGTFRVLLEIRDSQVPPARIVREFQLEIRDQNGAVCNNPPQFDTAILVDDKRHQKQTPYAFTITAHDDDPNDTLVFALTTPPASGTSSLTQTSDTTAEFFWDGMDNGQYDIVVTVTDQINTPVRLRWCVTVNDTGTGAGCNQPPQITARPKEYWNDPDTRLSPKTQSDAYELAQQNTPIAQNPPALRISAVDPEGAAIVYSLTQAPTGMTIDAATGIISWTPPSNFPTSDIASYPAVPNAMPVTPPADLQQIIAEVDDQSGNKEEVEFYIAVEPGPPQPSNIRVFIANWNTSGINPIVQTFTRDIEAIDVNIPVQATPSFITTDAWMAEGSARLALTGTKHNLRVGGDIPTERNLNSGEAFIQFPAFEGTDPNNTSQSVQMSGRLYMYNDAESSGAAETGTHDTAIFFPTTGSLEAPMAPATPDRFMVFDFGVPVHEEVYVPLHTKDFDGSPNWDNSDAYPMFVVTAEDGSRCWVCRVDHQGIPGGSTANLAMMEIRPPTNTTIFHQTITLAGVASTAPGNGNYVLWMAGQGASGHVLMRAPIVDPLGGSNGVDAEALPLDNGTHGLTVPNTVLISTYFAPSGNGERVALVAGNDMDIHAGEAWPTTPPANHLWRDIWVLDGTIPYGGANGTTRVTEFQDQANGSISFNASAAGANDRRLIDVLDAYSTLNGNFINGDDSGNDRRVVFGETVDDLNNTGVPHCMNYEGTLVGYVVSESNGANGDSTTENHHDEVYVSSVDAEAHTQLVRVTANGGIPASTDLAGSKCSAAHDFNLNAGVCTGLYFPMKSGDDGRNLRLFFTYGYYTLTVLDGAVSKDTNGEQCVSVYSSEFTLGASGAITHSSTADRTAGLTNATGASGQLLGGYGPTRDDLDNQVHRTIIGSAEGALGNLGQMIFVVLKGTGIGQSTQSNINLDPVASLHHMDITVANANVATSTGTVIEYLDADNNSILVYSPDDDRTFVSDGIEDDAPYNTTGNTEAVPHISHMFASTPGPTANTDDMANQAFVIGQNSAGGEELFRFTLATPNPAGSGLNLTNLNNQGRIHEIFPSNDGKSVAIIRSRGVLAGPGTENALPLYQTGTIYQDSDIFIIPHLDEVEDRFAQSLPKTAENPLGLQLGVDDISRSIVWVDTSSITPDTRELWYATGPENSASPNGRHLNHALTTRRVSIDISNTLGPTIGQAADVDSSQPPGGVFLFATGVIPQ